MIRVMPIERLLKLLTLRIGLVPVGERRAPKSRSDSLLSPESYRRVILVRRPTMPVDGFNRVRDASAALHKKIDCNGLHVRLTGISSASLADLIPGKAGEVE